MPLPVILDGLLRDFPARTAICNTVVTGDIAGQLADRGFTVVSLIHELSQLIRERNLEGCAETVAAKADAVIFASEFVKNSFEKITGPLNDKATVQPQGIYQHVGHSPDRRHELREKLGLSAQSKVVLNMGFGDLRKGFDLFVGVAKQVVAANPSCHFVWLGNLQADLKHWLQIDLLEAPLAGHFHVLPFDDDVDLYLNGADVYALTSREDPFPSVVLEALACGVPVVGFEGGGGYPEAIERESVNGTVVPMADVNAMANAVLGMLMESDPDAAVVRAAKAAQTYDWRDYVFGLLQAVLPGLKKISVVLPNYNYAPYLAERLGSIFDQEYPIYELIILDDKSTDDSVAVINELLSSANRSANVIVNTTNSGSVFKQWEKGARLATGDWVWIAEADDACTPEFLRDLAGEVNPDTKVAFCDSVQIDSNGQELGRSYGFYFSDLPSNPMSSTFSMNGSDFVSATLAIKNVILNVSSVVFNRPALLDVFDEYSAVIQSYKVAGDWFIYTTMLSQQNAQVVYVHRSHNIHRRHATSVTHALARQRHLEEIERVQSLAAEKNQLCENVADAAERYLREVTQQLESRDQD